MNINPSSEDRKRMRKAYEQLGSDLKIEDLENKQRRSKEEEEERRGKKWEWRVSPEEKRKKEKAAEPSYEKLQAEVKKYDDGMVAGWRDDIDTMLVFGGLFSAIVTAFLIESYQWLSEDTTIVLLTQISQQLNGTQSQPAPFTPDASSIRINCFWFLSLIFSLTSALFGLLCKQWLREHQRDVPTRTPGEDLALRQLRRDSFEKWGVASFLSALPILLEIALVFFFAGVLDLIWTLHPILFGICLAAISLSMGLYFLTTILPTITISRDQAQFIDTEDEDDNHHHDFGQLAYQFICPYKSPQAWAVYKLFTTLPKPLLNIPLINSFIKAHLRPLWDHIQAQTSSWSTFDLRVVRQFDQEVHFRYGNSFRLQVYELRALQWAVTMFRDSPSMVLHLYNVLETLPRSVAISAVLDRWDVAMWEVIRWDIWVYLGKRNRSPNMPGPKPVTSDVPLHSRKGIELLFWHCVWGFLIEGSAIGFLSESLKEFTQKFPKSSRSPQFFFPFPLATALWSNDDPWPQREIPRLLRHFEEAWKPSPGYDEERHNKERVAFAYALAECIGNWDFRSNLVLYSTRRGQQFVRFIHHEVINCSLYSRDDFNLYIWRDAIQKFQDVCNLPDDYFAPLPNPNDDPPPPSQLPQLEPIQYSIDTVWPQFDYPHHEDTERPPSPAQRIDIQVLGSTTSGILNLADAALVLGNANQGVSGSHAIDEGSTLPLDNDEATTALRTVAEGTNPSPDNSAVQAVENVIETVPLSAGDDEPANPDLFGQAPEDSAQAVSLPLEGEDEPADHGEQGIVGPGDIIADADQDTHTLSDNISLAILEPPDQRVAGTSSSRQEDIVGRDGVSGRIGWNPTNDPYSLRVHWFRP